MKRQTLKLTGLLLLSMFIACQDELVTEPNIDSENIELSSEDPEKYLDEKYKSVDIDQFKKSLFFEKIERKNESIFNSTNNTQTNIADSLDLSLAVEFSLEDTTYYTVPFFNYFDNHFVNLYIKEFDNTIEAFRLEYEQGIDSLNISGELIELENNPIAASVIEDHGWDCYTIYFEYVTEGNTDCQPEQVTTESYHFCQYTGGGGGGGIPSGGDSPSPGGGGIGGGFPTTTPIQPQNCIGDPDCDANLYQDCLNNGISDYCWQFCESPTFMGCYGEPRALYDLFNEFNLGLSLQEIDALDGYGQEMISYLGSNNNSYKRNRVASFARTRLELSNARWDRFLELYALLENNPNALLEDCFDSSDDYPIEFWSDLASFVPDITVKSRIQSEGEDWSIQDINHASGARVNLDYFSVKINNFGDIDNDGNTDTPQEFFEYWRKNFNDFVDTDISEFNYYETPHDQDLWQSNNPLTTIINIDIQTPFGGDDGAVICSDYCYCTESHWIFTTLKGPWGSSQENPGWHPVSGNRQFGYKINSDGTYTVYVKGADRTSNPRTSLLWGQPAYWGGDNLWESLQDKMVEKINESDGNAQAIQAVKKRPWYNKIKEKLIQSTPLTYIECQ